MRSGKVSVFPVLIVIVMLVGASAGAADAQSNIVLSLAVPQFMRDTFDSGVLDEFEAQNPGVQVNLVILPPTNASPTNGLDTYLETMQEYVQSGDVVFVNAGNFAPEGTRAGLFLDLAPLTNGDPTLNASDFIPGVWQSFQWDGGVWALPISTNATGLSYDRAAFDAAGLAYPTPGWTIDDLANAARALAQRSASGTVLQPGLAVSQGNVGLLLRSLLGQPYYDGSTLPNNPRLVFPELETLLTTMKTLVDEGVVSLSGGGGEDIPMTIGGNAIFFGPDTHENAPVTILLPGGTAGLSPSAFALSAGTQYPEQAYALARFLTSNPRLGSGFFGVAPARQSLRGVQAVGPGGFDIQFSPEMQAFIDAALASGLPYSEYRFDDYVGAALSQMVNEGVDALTALQQVEATAITNLQTADSRRSEMVVAVATPVPTPVLQPGEITLRFGFHQGNLLTANRDQWDQVANEFVAGDAQVGQVILDSPSGFGDDIAGMTESFDCFYMGSNAVPNLDLSLVLNLDPFMDTDPSFSRSDVVGNTLAQLQRDNRTWAYPINIQPAVMRYDPNQFAAAGVPAPTNGWTLDAFVDALQALKVNTGDFAPFALGNFGGTNLQMLIAAYGGLPFDYRTDPPTANFTDPATVDAIRQVLDLAKNGLIEYTQQGEFFGGGTLTPAADPPPITTQTFGGFNFGGIGVSIIGNPAQQVYEITTYPSGSQYTALSYNIGTAYISATAQNPDACYRLITALAQRPELFGSMPARRSQINSPAVVAAQGTETVAVYNQIDAQMQNPNTIIFPALFGGGGGTPATFLTQIWLNRAFDNYLMNDADLAAELETAQTYVLGFQGCVAGLPTLDLAGQSQQEHFSQYLDCAGQIDPSMSDFFGGG